MKRIFINSILVILLLLISGCASKFPTPYNSSFDFNTKESNASGTDLFKLTFAAHGGNNITHLINLNVSLDGKWKQLIRRIQPLVTDYKYRVSSEERLILSERIYSAYYTGPSGHKFVFRTPSSVNVAYNGTDNKTPEVLSSTALTADSFYLFLLGPLSLERWQNEAIRLSSKKLNGELHWRIFIKRKPGFGFSESDNIVLWINPISHLTSRVQISLEGHESTRGAHVEVDYLEYIEEQGFTFPSSFFERVNAPISIDAHAWNLTGLDINRDYTVNDLLNNQRNGSMKPAKAILGKAK